MDVKWRGGDKSWYVAIGLVDVTDWVTVKQLTTKTANIGKATVTLPASLPSCDHTYLFYVQEVKQKQWAYGSEFSVACEPLGTAVTGMTATTGSLSCKNLTTKKTVSFKIGAGVRSWDCSDAGLLVKSGDKIQVTLTATGRAD